MTDLPLSPTEAQIARVIRAAKETGVNAVIVAGAEDAWSPRRWETSGSLVYFVKIARNYIKIGFSTNLPKRLRLFRTVLGSEPTIIGTLAGGRDEETRLHRALRASRISNELFEYDYRLEGFLAILATKGQEAAWEYLDKTDPDYRARAAIQQRKERRAAEKRARAQENAYYASLVAERKRAVGW